MPQTPENRQRLAELMDARRRDLRLRWQDVADAGGISLKTLHSVRTGEAGMAPLTMSAIEDGLRWEPGSVRQILDGGDPVPAVPQPPAAVLPGVEDMLTPEERARLQPFANEVLALVRKAAAKTGQEDPDGIAVFGSGTDEAAQEAAGWNLLRRTAKWPPETRAWIMAEARAQFAEEGTRRGRRRRNGLTVSAGDNPATACADNHGAVRSLHTVIGRL